MDRLKTVRIDIDRWAAPLVAVASLASLAAAFIGEHWLGIEPCVLCLYQRVPYAATAVIAVLAAALPLGRPVRALCLGVCAAIFLAGAGLAFYHVGVEAHWWTTAIPGCAGELPDDLTVAELQALLQDPPRRPCDEVTWRLFGLTLAAYNTMLSLVLAVATAAAAAHLAKGANR
ncbi:MAG: disulfide bond formation protein B [Rhodospirillales bacterium]|nr:MAG: disulfide bond formation protein B [Rhodospirillales bacterium]